MMTKMMTMRTMIMMVTMIPNDDDDDDDVGDDDDNINDHENRMVKSVITPNILSTDGSL